LPFTRPLAWITSLRRAVISPWKAPRISATSTSTLPLKDPVSAIWISRLTIVASTRPSTTSVSQSSISTPRSLMLGPTVRRLGAGAEDAAVASLDGVGAGGGETAAGAAGCANGGRDDRIGSGRTGTRASRGRLNRLSVYFIGALPWVDIREASIRIRAIGAFPLYESRRPAAFVVAGLPPRCKPGASR
jgi:hypothetical protein